MNFTKRLVAMFAVLTFGTFASLAQSTVTGGISGKISDPQGAIVTGATVTITNIGTNASSTTTSSNDGVFRVANRIAFLENGKLSFTGNADQFMDARVDAIRELVHKSQATEFLKHD
jgi:hypothetical protein